VVVGAGTAGAACALYAARAGLAVTVSYVEADLRFHLGLPALAGNGHLVEVVRDLRRRSRLYGLTAPAEQGRLEASAEEHWRYSTRSPTATRKRYGR
jgi:flavin-dependent dehydrogenase